MDENIHEEGNRDLSVSGSLTLPVIEEHLEVGKRVVETGRVHVSTTVSERKESVDLPLTHEEVDVTRVSINKYIDSPSPEVRYEGDTMIIPIIKEVAVVEKRLMLVEEIHVTKRRVETHHREEVTLLKEEVHIERTGSGSTSHID